MVVIVDEVDVCVDIPILLKQKAYGMWFVPILSVLMDINKSYIDSLLMLFSHALSQYGQTRI